MRGYELVYSFIAYLPICLISHILIITFREAACIIKWSIKAVADLKLQKYEEFKSINRSTPKSSSVANITLRVVLSIINGISVILINYIFCDGLIRAPFLLIIFICELLCRCVIKLIGGLIVSLLRGIAIPIMLVILKLVIVLLTAMKRMIYRMLYGKTEKS